MKTRKKKILCAIVSGLMMFSFCFSYVNATPQSDLNKTNQKINDINSKKNQAQNEANAISSEIVTIMASVSMMEDEVAAKREELHKIQVELQEAQKKETDQNNAMKARIKSIYEKGNTAYLTAFLESKSFADLVNKMEYASTIYDYDKTMLDDLTESKKKVQELESRVSAEEAELSSALKELQEEKYQMDVKLNKLKASIKDYDKQLANAKTQAAKYKAQIEEQNKQYTQNQDYKGGGQGSGTKTDYTIPSDGTKGAQVVQYACQFIGNPYVWGGNDLYNGIDCSGFTKAVFAHFGVSIPRYSGDQQSVGVAVSMSEARPGDLVCYAGHVAIYMGNGNAVHASYEAPYPKGGIKVSSVYMKPIITIRRLV